MTTEAKDKTVASQVQKLEVLIPLETPVVAVIVTAKDTHQILSVQEGLHESLVLASILEARRSVIQWGLDSLLRERIVGVDSGLFVLINALLLLESVHGAYRDVDKGV